MTAISNIRRFLLGLSFLATFSATAQEAVTLTVIVDQEDQMVYVSSSDGETQRKYLTSTGIGYPDMDSFGRPTQTSTRKNVDADDTDLSDNEPYKVLWRKIDHVSKQYEDSTMNFAIFFHGSGQALHETPSSNWKKLGRPASHGCVRLDTKNASELWNLVEQYGPENTRVYVRGEVRVNDEKFINDFKILDEKLAKRHTRNLNKGIVDPLPDDPSVHEQMVIYGRIYNRNADSGVYLPQDSDYNNVDHNGEGGYSGNEGFFGGLFDFGGSDNNENGNANNGEPKPEKESRKVRCKKYKERTGKKTCPLFGI